MISMSYGGGKQTVAIITLMLEGRLPKPDIIVMADTGREVKSTVDYLERVVQPSLKQIGLSVEIAGHDYAHVDLYGGDTLLLPVFTTQSGRRGKLPTYCSNEWKRFVIQRWLRNRGVKETDVWLGISTDELERMKESSEKWFRHVYPLIEMVPMNRDQCIAQIRKHGWPIPNKSRCWMCPNQSIRDWQNLKRNSPDEFEKAIVLEREIRQKDKHMYLHPQAAPLDEAVENSEQQAELFDGCDSGFCFT